MRESLHFISKGIALMRRDLRPKFNLGIGGVCSVIKKYLHPQRVVRECEAWEAVGASERIEDLLAVGQKELETGRGSARKKKMLIVFRHDAVPNTEIFCVHSRCMYTVIKMVVQNDTLDNYLLL